MFDIFRQVTLALPVLASFAAIGLGEEESSPSFPDLPEGITSFGGAIAGDWLYVYGGHMGEAHHYWKLAQDNHLRRINIHRPTKWATVAEGPHLQGHALVAHEGKLYRIGGFTARNEEGAEDDLHSTAEVAQFDPESLSDPDRANGENAWSAFPALPEPRSSHDAVVLGDHLYVVGGWQLNGDEPSRWHTAAYRINLQATDSKWEKLPPPPFQRRALALGTCSGEVYVIGGMEENGGPTTQVAVYNPVKRQWRNGPAIPGEGMEGFGASAFEVNGTLYASTISGKLLQLNDNDDAWSVVRELRDARFFHRLLPLGPHRLIMVGGANMQSGKFLAPEVVDLNSID